MIIETVDIPENEEELAKLSKDKDIFIVYNVFAYLQRYVKDAKPDDNYKLRPLYKAIDFYKKDNFDIKVLGLLLRLRRKESCLIRIKEVSK